MEKFNQAKYKQQFDKENYDRILVRLPKGAKEKLKEYIEENNIKSLNDYFVKKIENDLEGERKMEKIILIRNKDEVMKRLHDCMNEIRETCSDANFHKTDKIYEMLNEFDDNVENCDNAYYVTDMLNYLKPIVIALRNIDSETCDKFGIDY